eukprot:s236_g30.t1
MLLSFRGSERQPPNALQMALRFSIAMQERAASGCHAASMSAEDRLRAVTKEFNETPGMLVKRQVDQVKFDGIYNLITGTSRESRDQIAAHLHVNKWHFSALNVELLKRNRWLLGAVPKGISDEFKRIMVVTPESQSFFLELIFHHLYVKTRKGDELEQLWRDSRDSWKIATTGGREDSIMQQMRSWRKEASWLKVETADNANRED